jgi:hypothetical protein
MDYLDYHIDAKFTYGVQNGIIIDCVFYDWTLVKMHT